MLIATRYVLSADALSATTLPITIIGLSVPTNANPGKGRILALDLGKKRIGLALSDPLGVTAQGLPTLEGVNIRTDLTELDRLATEHDVGLILLGLPLHMSGDGFRPAGHAVEFPHGLTE